MASRQIGVALVQQAGDNFDKVIDQAGGGLDHIGGLDVQLGTVGEKGVRVELGDLHDGLVLPAGALEHLVLSGICVRAQVSHVSDVHHPVHIVARPAQELLQHILHDIGAQVPDVSKVIHCRAAGVHLHMARGVGGKGLFFVGCRII